MSLYTTRKLFVGHDQPSVAMMTLSGVTYRCYAWLNNSSYRVDTACFEVQPDGTEVLVFHNVVAEATPTEVSDTGGIPLDCPRIIAADDRFWVFWLQAEDGDGELGIRNYSIHRAYMLMGSFDVSGWTEISELPIHEPYALYNVCPVQGDGDYHHMVVRATAEDEITVGRYTRAGTVVWVTAVARAIEGRVLAVYAHEPDNNVIITYEADNEGASTQLYSMHLDADDGGTVAEVQTFTGIGNAVWVQVGHVRTSSTNVAVIAECLRDDETNAAAAASGEDGASYLHMHYTCGRLIVGATAARTGNEHHWPNVGMASLPWGYSNGSTSAGNTPNLYCILSYRSVYLSNEWEQSALFACNLNFAHWQLEDTGSVVRPRPIVNFVHTGVPDARTSAWHPNIEDGFMLIGSDFCFGPIRRMNHLSPAVPCQTAAGGADLKAFVAAVGVFARKSVQSSATAGDADYSEIVPENLGVTGFVVHMEDPWTIYRDSTAGTQPTANYKGAQPRAMCQAHPAGRTTFFSGGTPYLYDGAQTFEVGYPWAPEIFEINGSDESGDLDGDSWYQYYACYTWRDHQGQMHRSAPSRIVTAAVGTLGNAATMQIRMQNLSLRDSTMFAALAESIQVELFRTLALDSDPTAIGAVPSPTAGGDAIFYRIHASGIVTGSGGGQVLPERTPLNDPTALYIEYIDGLNDQRLQYQGRGPYQYQADPAAGLIGPIPSTAPALSVSAPWLNRIFGADALDPSIIWYTDEIFPDYGSDYALAPFFSPTLTFRIGEIGDITAMQSMNNAMMVFTERAIYALLAQDAGSGLLQINSELLHVGVGCIEPRSVVLGEDGIYFQSSKGYYLLDRGRGLQYLPAGAGVEDEIRTAGNVRSATYLEDRNQVRVVINGAFSTTPTPRVLILDTLQRKWSRADLVQTSATARLAENVDGCTWKLSNGETGHCVLTQGALLVERESTAAAPYADATSVGNVGIPIDVQTSWLHFAGVAGYQRIKSLGIQGEKPNASEYRVDLDYVRDGNYSSPESETDVFVATASPSYTRVRPTIQKCSAIRVRIREQSSVAGTENLRLVNLIFELGIKPGPRRVAPTQIGS